MEQNSTNGAPRTYHVEGGDGPYSYAHNSSYQKQLVDSEKDWINELILEHFDIGNPCSGPYKSYRIADFGCSIGPNTFSAVENIIEAIEDKYKSTDNSQILEFHVFFNDNVDNDFNALFRNFPASRQYYAAGVPGSFHGRLLPSATLHIAHCSTALHWLSKIPEEVTDRRSFAWNKGRIHYTGAANEVKAAYSTQFGKDFNSFLNARAKELVPGGLMILTTIGFPDGVQVSESSMGENFSILGSCLQDMAKMGVINETMVDSFNLPFYYPSPSELKKVIEANGLFNIKRIEKLAGPMTREKPNLQVCLLHLRAVIGGLIREHFGEVIIENLFELHKKKCAENPVLYDEKYWKEANYFLFLKKNNTDQNP